MNRPIWLLRYATLGVAFVAACSDSGSGPEEVTYENIAATYEGSMVGVSEGIALEADFSVTITQNGGSLSGSWSIAGAITDGEVIVPIQGSGSLTGTIASGRNPSVNLTRSGGPCNRSATYSGTYDSTNQRLNLVGPVEILNAADCSVIVSYQLNLLLTR